MRKIVYTCVVGGRDRLHAPAVVEPSVDYVVFSDNPNQPAPCPWQLRPILRRERNPRMTARWHKLHPHFLFPGHEQSLYVDSNILLKAPIASFVERMLANSPIALFRHPERDCAYREAEIVKRYRLDDAAIVEAQMEYYKSKGYPADAGLHYGGFLMLRHTDAGLIAFLEDWWRQLKVFSHRDQLSLDFVLRRHGIPFTDIPGALSESTWLAIAPRRRYRVHVPDIGEPAQADELDWLRMALIAEVRRWPSKPTLSTIMESLRWHLMEPLRAMKRGFLLLTWRSPAAIRSGAKLEAVPDS